MKYDLIVVGGGPSGAAAARYGALMGMKTLLIEKETLPRYKVCGGALTPAVKKYLDFDYSSVVERRVRGVSFFSEGKRFHTVFPEGLEIELISRETFDQRLVEEAVSKGARFMDGSRVLSVEEGPGEVVVRLKGGESLTAAVVVGADGAAGIVPRSCSLRNPPGGVALEIEIYPKETNHLADFGDRVFFGFGYVPQGYAWLFPKGDHFSLGIGSTRDLSKELSPALERFKTRFPFLKGGTELLRRRWLLPFSNGNRRLNTARICLVGDAASLMDPFSGEGIYYGLWSAAIARETAFQDLAASGSFTGRYSDAVNSLINDDFSYARRYAAIYYRAPSLFYNKNGIIRLFVGLARRDFNYSGILSRAEKGLMSRIRTRLFGRIK